MRSCTHRIPHTMKLLFCIGSTRGTSKATADVTCCCCSVTKARLETGDIKVLDDELDKVLTDLMTSTVLSRRVPKWGSRRKVREKQEESEGKLTPLFPRVRTLDLVCLQNFFYHSPTACSPALAPHSFPKATPFFCCETDICIIHTLKRLEFRYQPRISDSVRCVCSFHVSL